MERCGRMDYARQPNIGDTMREKLLILALVFLLAGCAEYGSEVVAKVDYDQNGLVVYRWTKITGLGTNVREFVTWSSSGGYGAVEGSNNKSCNSVNSINDYIMNSTSEIDDLFGVFVPGYPFRPIIDIAFYNPNYDPGKERAYVYFWNVSGNCWTVREGTMSNITAALNP
jgi:hypothetical protein